MDSIVPKPKTLLTVSCIGLALLVLSSCSSLGRDSKKDEKTLLVAVDAFNTSVRWGDAKDASVWVIPQLHDYFWTLTDELHARIRIMDFEVRQVSSISASDMEPTSEVILRYRFYHTDDPHLQSQTIHERWRYFEKEKGWQLIQHDLQGLLSATQQ
jgi:hypothetical protein